MRRGNLRDLGGLPAGSGRTVRSGILFRSEAPVTLDEPDRRRLAGVALVFDLRALGEGDDALAVWGPDGPEIVQVPLAGHDQLFDPDILLGMCTSVAYARRYMNETYDQFFDALRTAFLPEVASRIGELQRVPALVHCAGGKDRTGVAVAAVLLALGVPREAVVADYVRTAESFDLGRLMDHMQVLLGPRTWAVEAAVAQLCARPEYIEGAIDRLLTEHGSIEAYWATAGVDRSGLDRLRSVLLK